MKYLGKKSNTKDLSNRTDLEAKQDIIDNTHKLNAALIDDTGSVNKFLPLNGTNGQVVTVVNGSAAWADAPQSFLPIVQQLTSWNVEKRDGTISPNLTLPTPNFNHAEEIRYSFTAKTTNATFIAPSGMKLTDGTNFVIRLTYNNLTVDGVYSVVFRVINNLTIQAQMSSFGVYPMPNYLCFTANTAGSTVGMSKTGTAIDPSLQYSTDQIHWDTFTVGTTTITLSKVGDKVYFKGNNSRMCFGDYNYVQFTMSGSIAASGNVMSILDETCESTTLTQTYALAYLFSGCSSLTSPPELPATTLSNYCYANMFYYCSGLTSAPNLPATNLTKYCYFGMFRFCSNLVTAMAELPAIVLKDNCYQMMFNYCESLTTSPHILATQVEANIPCAMMFSSCSKLSSIKISYTGFFDPSGFSSWVSGVASSGTFYYNGSDTTRGNSAIPSNWTIQTF